METRATHASHMFCTKLSSEFYLLLLLLVTFTVVYFLNVYLSGERCSCAMVCMWRSENNSQGSVLSSTQTGSKLLSHLTISLAPLRSSKAKRTSSQMPFYQRTCVFIQVNQPRTWIFCLNLDHWFFRLKCCPSSFCQPVLPSLVAKDQMVRAWQAGISLPFRPMNSSSAVDSPSTTQPQNQLFYFSDDSQKTMQVSVGNSSWVTPRPEFLSHLGCSTSISMKSQQVQNGKGPKEHLIQFSHFPRSKLIPSRAKAFTLPLSMFQIDPSEIQMEYLGQECSSEVKLAQHEQALGSTSSTTNMNTQLVTQF